VRPSECGFANPPADGTRNRELVDRFADFIRAAGPPVTRAQVEAGQTVPRPPHERYALRLLAWRMSTPAVELAEALNRKSPGQRDGGSPHP
jgi:hypothetical protein